MSWLGLSAPATVGLIVLAATALPVLLFGNSTVRSRWLTWAAIGLIVGAAEAIGVAGAVVVAVAVSVVCIVEYVELAGLRAADRWVLLLSAAVGAPLGDVIASMVKRHAGVKDAGTWLPGFGGLLDRADSLLVVAPLFSVTLA